MLTFGHEVSEKLSDSHMADLVLHPDGTSDHRHVPFSFYINSARKMVSIFFRHGENLGKMHFIRHGLLV